MDVKLSSQRTCQNSVIKILLAVGAGIWGEGACPPRPRVAVSQVSRCLPGLPSPPAFPEQQASWLPGPCLSRFLKELSAPAGFPRCPGPLTCARPRARGSQAACPLGRGFGGRRCPCHGGGKQTGPSEDRSALGRTLPGRAEGEQAGERGEDEGGVPRVGWGSWGGSARPRDTQQQHWHLRAGGHSMPESTGIGRQFFSFHPQIKPPRGGIMETMLFSWDCQLPWLRGAGEL